MSPISAEKDRCVQDQNLNVVSKVGVHVKQRRRAALALVQHVREAAANIAHQVSQCPLINTHKQTLFK